MLGKPGDCQNSSAAVDHSKNSGEALELEELGPADSEAVLAEEAWELVVAWAVAVVAALPLPARRAPSISPTTPPPR